LAVVWPLDRQITRRTSKSALRVAALGSALVVIWLMTKVEVFDPALYRHGVLLLVAALSAVMLVGFSTLPRVDPLTSWLGRRSYGIYLWSWPIQLFVSDKWPYASQTVVASIVVAISLIAAEISWHLVEYPVQRGVRWARYSTNRRRVGAVMALASLVAISAVFTTSTARFGLPQVPDDLHLVTAALAEGGTTLDSNGHGLPTEMSDDSVSADQVVLLYGDSVALTMYEYFPWGDPPDNIVSVIGRADIGCGLLAPLKYEFPYVGIYASVTREHCVNNDAWFAGGLALHPNVVVLMPGAWEWSEARSPSGEMIESQSPQMAALLAARIGELAGRADAAGARTVVLPWACPGHRDDLPQRREASYIRWINDVLEGAVADVDHLPIEMAKLPPGVCQGDDPAGRPTSAKNDAFRNEIHVRDAAGGRWAWHHWIGPSIAATGAL